MLSITSCGDGNLFKNAVNPILSPSNEEGGTIDFGVMSVISDDVCELQHNKNVLDPNECRILIEFFNSTGGENWTKRDNWGSEDVPVNQWYGLYLKPGLKKVGHISFYNNNLTGTLPSSLGELTQLSGLNIRNNNIAGNIPSSLGNLSKLTHLNLEHNYLTGSIPTSLGNLSPLRYLHLNGNKLNGSIPSELGNLSYLSFLSLEHNMLTGSIPEIFKNKSQANIYHFHQNCLSNTNQWVNWANASPNTRQVQPQKSPIVCSGSDQEIPSTIEVELSFVSLHNPLRVEQPFKVVVTEKDNNNLDMVSFYFGNNCSPANLIVATSANYIDQVRNMAGFHQYSAKAVSGSESSACVSAQVMVSPSQQPLSKPTALDVLPLPVKVGIEETMVASGGGIAYPRVVKFMENGCNYAEIGSKEVSSGSTSSSIKKTFFSQGHKTIYAKVCTKPDSMDIVYCSACISKNILVEKNTNILNQKPENLTISPQSPSESQTFTLIASNGGVTNGKLVKFFKNSCSSGDLIGNVGAVSNTVNLQIYNGLVAGQYNYYAKVCNNDGSACSMDCAQLNLTIDGSSNPNVIAAPNLLFNPFLPVTSQNFEVIASGGGVQIGRSVKMYANATCEGTPITLYPTSNQVGLTSNKGSAGTYSYSTKVCEDTNCSTCKSASVVVSNPVSTNTPPEIISVSPVSSQNPTASVTISGGGVTSGKLVQVYKKVGNINCSYAVGQLNVPNGATQVVVSTIGLSVGEHILHAKVCNPGSVSCSACSSNFASYTVLSSNNPPPPPNPTLTPTPSPTVTPDAPTPSPTSPVPNEAPAVVDVQINGNGTNSVTVNAIASGGGVAADKKIIFNIVNYQSTSCTNSVPFSDVIATDITAESGFLPVTTGQKRMCARVCEIDESYCSDWASKTFVVNGPNNAPGLALHNPDTSPGSSSNPIFMATIAQNQSGTIHLQCSYPGYSGIIVGSKVVPVCQSSGGCSHTISIIDGNFIPNIVHSCKAYLYIHTNGTTTGFSNTVEYIYQVD